MKRIGIREIDAAVEVLSRDPICLSGYYKNPRGGPSVQAFEDALGKYHDRTAICVSNGTSALHTALLACGIERGDSVITTPLTFSATATAILMAGARPLFVDVDPLTYNIDPDRIKCEEMKSARAIIPVHLLGMPCDMDPIIEFAQEHNLYIIEDNAQAIGAKYKGKKTGTFGDISTVSFQETKMITTGGEGGAILTSNDELAAKCRYLRNHGSQYGRVPYLTYNYRMTELQAAIGLVQLDRLDGFIKTQVENAKILLRNIPCGIYPPSIPKYASPTFYIIGCLAEKFLREQFIKNLTARGINKNLPGATVGLGYTGTIMELPLLNQYWRPCPIAETLVDLFLWFDVLRWKTKDEATRIVEVIKECIPSE